MRSTCVQLSPPQSKEKSWEKRIMVGKSGETANGLNERLSVCMCAKVQASEWACSCFHYDRKISHPLSLLLLNFPFLLFARLPQSALFAAFATLCIS